MLKRLVTYKDLDVASEDVLVDRALEENAMLQ